MRMQSAFENAGISLTGEDNDEERVRSCDAWRNAKRRILSRIRAEAARNEADHGVTFEMAKDVFKDPFAIEWLDDREDHGEDRYVIIGMVTTVCSLSLTP